MRLITSVPSSYNSRIPDTLRGHNGILVANPLAYIPLALLQASFYFLVRLRSFLRLLELGFS
jgi:hypothetical protein